MGWTGQERFQRGWERIGVVEGKWGPRGESVSVAVGCRRGLEHPSFHDGHIGSY